MSAPTAFFFPGEDHTLACLLRPQVARIVRERDERAIAACTVTDELSEAAGLRVVGVDKDELTAAFRAALEEVERLKRSMTLTAATR